MNKVLLCILDGVGISEEKKGNAFFNANTKNLDHFMNEFPYKNIDASGESVGLPHGQMGNSEVGHLTIGAGRIIYQSLELINKSIISEEFYKNDVLIGAIKHSKENGSKLHIMGLLSDGGIHSHINHIISVLRLCEKEKFDKVCFHIFTDGRDTYYKSSIKYLDKLSDEINKCGFGKICTISGRFYGMDRDKRYDRIKKSYDAIMYGVGNESDDYHDYINKCYERNITDEFIEPVVLNKEGIIENNDSIIWCNFRPDRAIEILDAITNDTFNAFERKNIKNIYLSTLMYVADNIKSNIAFKKEEVDNTLGIYLSKLGKKQLRIAETEKYAHVTYFFDGGRDIELDGEKRILIPSPKVSTYDLKPEMSANEITDILITEMNNSYDFILLNFANGDMVGHTGNYEATIKAMETIDLMLSKIYERAKEIGYTLIITADHGNCECMIKDGKEVTSHTSNKVPFIVLDKNVDITSVNRLSDIAPFILNYMNIEVPDEMKN